jgi:hypothetical protein
MGGPVPANFNEGETNGNKNKPDGWELPLNGIVGDFEYCQIAHRCGDCNTKPLSLSQGEDLLGTIVRHQQV